VGVAAPTLVPRVEGGRPSRRDALVEFLLVGGITPLLFPISWLLQAQLGLDEAAFRVGFTFFWAAHVINDPHFAVTYFLFYAKARERAFGDVFGRAQKVRYWLAGLVVPLAILAAGSWAILAMHPEVLGALFQAMFLLVGWHYVKQGFGVMMVLSARRGVRWAPRERFAILFHCYAGWAYAWANPAKEWREVAQKGVVYTAMPRPGWLETLALTVLIASSAALFFVLARKWRRERRLPVITPLTALLMSVWAWMVFSTADPLVAYAVPALHGLQYLFFVRLLKANEAKAREGPPHFETSARTRVWMLGVGALILGFVLFDALPDLLDSVLVPPGGYAEERLGLTPWLALVFVFVNVHHYFMDSVIWRRDNPETRYLVT